MNGTNIVLSLPELNNFSMKSLFILTSICLFMGCNSSKLAQNETNTMDNAQEIKEMTDQGYLMGTIQGYSTEGNCPFIIEVAAETPYYLDPINLEESFKKEGTQIWFTFAGLRMMNRCVKANPISILDIKKRAE